MDAIHDWLVSLNLNEQVISATENFIGALAILAVAFLANFIAKKIILNVVTLGIRKSRIDWDDVFLDSGVFTRLSHIVPAIAINWLVPLLFGKSPEMLRFTHIAVNIYLIAIVLWVIDAILNAVLAIYERIGRARASAEGIHPGGKVGF